MATKHAGKRSVAFAKKKEITSEDEKVDTVQPWNKWTKGGRGGRGGGRGGRGGRGSCGGRGGDWEEAGTEFDPKNHGKYLNKRAWFKLSEEQMELSRKARKDNPPKKRKVSAFSTVRISAAISGARSDQVKDLATRKAAAVASVKATKDVLKTLMKEKPTLMDKLTPVEAAMKPAAKPTPAAASKPTPVLKKKSSLKSLPLINISATQQVHGGTVRFSNALAELRAASAAKKKEEEDAAEVLVDTDDE